MVVLDLAFSWDHGTIQMRLGFADLVLSRLNRILCIYGSRSPHSIDLMLVNSILSLLSCLFMLIYAMVYSLRVVSDWLISLFLGPIAPIFIVLSSIVDLIKLGSASFDLFERD